MPTLTAALLHVTPGCAGALVIFFALTIGHALADYPLQGEFLSVAKNRHADARYLFGGNAPPPGLWAQLLAAHALIHAGVVWMITGSPALAAIEAAAHWLIDFAKCEKWTSYSADQILHLICKAAYAAAIVSGATWVSWSA